MIARDRDEPAGWCVLDGMRHYLIRRSGDTGFLGCGEEIPLAELGGTWVDTCLYCINYRSGYWL